MSHQLEALLPITATGGREEEKKSGRRDEMVRGREEMGREREKGRAGEGMREGLARMRVEGEDIPVHC